MAALATLTTLRHLQNSRVLSFPVPEDGSQRHPRFCLLPNCPTNLRAFPSMTAVRESDLFFFLGDTHRWAMSALEGPRRLHPALAQRLRALAFFNEAGPRLWEKGQEQPNVAWVSEMQKTSLPFRPVCAELVQLFDDARKAWENDEQMEFAAQAPKADVPFDFYFQTRDVSAAETPTSEVDGIPHWESRFAFVNRLAISRLPSMFCALDPQSAKTFLTSGHFPDRFLHRFFVRRNDAENAFVQADSLRVPPATGALHSAEESLARTLALISGNKLGIHWTERSLEFASFRGGPRGREYSGKRNEAHYFPGPVLQPSKALGKVFRKAKVPLPKTIEL